MTVIYSGLFGDYDVFKEVKIKDPNARYILFTDNRKLKSNTWEVVYIDNVTDPRLQARILKTQPYIYLPYHDYNIWIDASFEPICNDWSVFTNKKSAIQVYHHPVRDCLYNEAKTCKKMGIDNIDIINKQIDDIRKDGFPPHYGLYATGFMVRKDSKGVRKLLDMWCSMIINGSIRDQLSFTYCVWKHNIEIDAISGSIFNNEFLKRQTRHNKPQEYVRK